MPAHISNRWSFIMSAHIEITDSAAFDLAQSIADTQKAKLREQQMHQISDDDMQVGETWFVWGIFSAISDDRPRQQKLLADYLARKIQPRGDSAKIVRATLARDSEGNQLFNAISTAGRQAYHEDGDHHLSKIAAIFLNAIKNH